MNKKLNAQEKQNTFGIVMSAIRERGIGYVRKIAFGEDEKHTNEAIAIGMWLNTRMHGREMINKLDYFKD